MSWTDKELDELFKDVDTGQSFEYKVAYFKDIEAQLPVNNRKKIGLIWFWGGASLILIIFSTLFLLDKNKKSEVQLAYRSAVGFKNSKETTYPLNKIIVRATKGDNRTKRDVFMDNVSQSIGLKTQNKIDDKCESEQKTEKSALNFENVVFEERGALNQLIESVNVGSLNIAHVQTLNPLSTELVTSEFSYSLLKRSKSKFYVEFVGGIGQSPIRSSENGSAKSLSWGLGGGYIYAKNNWSLSAGAGVGELYFDNLFIKERSTIYGFGVNTFDNHYQFTSLFKLDLPLNFSYKFGSHELNAGLNTSVPLFTKVSFVEIKDGQENGNGKSFSTTSPYFRKVFFEPSIGYRFELENNWSIGAALKAQIINPLGSDRIKGDRSKMPLSGQITLRRTFDLH